MAVTPTYSWPIPNLSDLADGPDGFSDLALAIENTVKDNAYQSYTPAWTSSGSIQPVNPAARYGRYRVDNGICQFSARLDFGPSTGGGTGDLRISLPRATAAGEPTQLLQAMTLIPGYAYFQGIAYVSPSDTVVSPFFTVGGANTNVSPWLSAPASGPNTGIAAGNGIPGRAGGNTIANGGWIIVSGSYFCV